MNNSKLVQEAKLNPTRIYQWPRDVLRDRRLQDSERFVILTAWLEAAQERDVAMNQAPQPAVSLQELKAAWLEVKERRQAPLATE
jgi:hypothetical protein